MTDHPDPGRRWNNRRRMAWISLMAIIGFGVGAMVNEFTQPQADIISAVIYTLGAIIGAYVGFVTLDDKWQNGK
ncbi:MAG: hypothetical protein GTN99_08115 [Candidatus Dadabacteria bacterium]|nr:hypothetical protein [Candidatus Dadabacteria bacterium]